MQFFLIITAELPLFRVKDSSKLPLTYRMKNASIRLKSIVSFHRGENQYFQKHLSVSSYSNNYTFPQMTYTITRLGICCCFFIVRLPIFNECGTFQSIVQMEPLKVLRAHTSKVNRFQLPEKSGWIFIQNACVYFSFTSEIIIVIHTQNTHTLTHR